MSKSKAIQQAATFLAKTIGNRTGQSMNPLTRAMQKMNTNFIVFRVKGTVGKLKAFYNQGALASGKMDIGQFDKLHTSAQTGLVKEALQNTTGEFFSPRKWFLANRTGLSTASREVISRNAKIMKQAEKAKDSKTWVSAFKEIMGQYKGAGLADLTSGADTFSARIALNTLKDHKLDKELLDIVLRTQLGANSTVKNPIVMQAKTMFGSNFANDMARAETTKAVDYALGHAARQGASLEQTAQWLNRDLRKTFIRQLKKRKGLQNATPQQLEGIANRIPSPSATIKDGKLIIQDVVMSGDYTAAYAPISTIVRPNFSFKRVMSDMYDGGNVGKIMWGDLLNPKVLNSKVLNRAWNLPNKGRRLIQVSTPRYGSYVDLNHQPVLYLRKGKAWQSMRRTKKYQQAKDLLVKNHKISPEQAEEQLLLSFNKVVKANIAKGHSPYEAIHQSELWLKGAKLNPVQALRNVQALPESKEAKLAIEFFRKTGKKIQPRKESYKIKNKLSKEQAKQVEDNINLVRELEARNMLRNEKAQFFIRRALQLGAAGGAGAGAVYGVSQLIDDE